MTKKDRAAAAAAVASGPEEDCLVAKLLAEMGKGNMSSVNALLDAGASVDGCFESNHAELNHAGRPPLVSAALDGNINAVDLLIRRGADVDARGSMYRVVYEDDEQPKMLKIEGTRPLHAAVAGNSLSAVRSLVRNGADPNTSDSEGFTPLLLCAVTTSPDKAKCAVEIAKELIKGGADVGVVNKDGSCSLLLAALKDNLRMMEELVKAGGDCSVANSDGATALIVAAALGNTEMARLVLSAAPTTLNDTCPFELQPGKHCTALHAAAGRGHEPTVEFLLDAGAKQPTFSDERIAKCPLRTAVYCDHSRIVAILLRKKGLEAIGGVSCIPAAMDSAVRFKRIVILQMLLNVEGEDRKQHWARGSFKGRSVLHWAVSHGNLAVMSVLLAAGADETALTDDLGQSPFSHVVPCSCCGRERDLVEEAARCRMLSRGPAFRARSWAWPASTVSKRAASAGPADAGISVVRPSRAPNKIQPWLGVRIYRPESRKNYGTWYARLSMKGNTLHERREMKKATGKGARRRPCYVPGT